jgi:hypothetical protein
VPIEQFGKMLAYDMPLPVTAIPICINPHPYNAAINGRVKRGPATAGSVFDGLVMHRAQTKQHTHFHLDQ